MLLPPRNWLTRPDIQLSIRTIWLNRISKVWLTRLSKLQHIVIFFNKILIKQKHQNSDRDHFLWKWIIVTECFVNRSIDYCRMERDLHENQLQNLQLRRITSPKQFIVLGLGIYERLWKTMNLKIPSKLKTLGLSK